MKAIKSSISLIWIIIFISGCSSGDAPQAEPPEVVTQQEVTPEPEVASEHPIDTFIAKIEALTKDITPREYEVGQVRDFTCSNQDYGQKQHLYCYDGGLNARDIVAYYDEQGIIIAALFTIEKFNASPANVEEYDEKETVKKQYKLVFKDNFFRKFETILDENNHPVALPDNLLGEWDEFPAVIPPYILSE